MRTYAPFVACALFAVAGFAPAAQAHMRHRHHVHAAMMAPMASPVMDDKGQFYATPVSSGPADLGELRVVPGLDIATGVVGGAAQVPGAVLAVPGAVLAPVVPR